MIHSVTSSSRWPASRKGHGVREDQLRDVGLSRDRGEDAQVVLVVEDRNEQRLPRDRLEARAGAHEPAPSLAEPRSAIHQVVVNENGLPSIEVYRLRKPVPAGG